MLDPDFKRGLKLLVTDLDGTVLFEDGQGVRATDRMGAALRSLQSRGVTVTLASGRIHHAIKHIADHLGLSGPIISCNGAQIWLPDHDQDDGFCHHEPLASDVAREVVTACQQRGLQLNYYLPEGIYAPRFQPYWDIYQGRTAAPMFETTDLMPLLDRAPTKLLVFSEPETIVALRDEWREKLVGRANVLITADEYLEFMSPAVNKGAAVARLARRLGLEPRAILTAGDSYNDIEMIRWGGCGLAVSNGREELKAEADYLIEPPQQSGLAAFIEEHLLGQTTGI